MKYGILMLITLLLQPIAIVFASEVEGRYTRSDSGTVKGDHYAWSGSADLDVVDNRGWSASIGVGAVSTSGNSKTKNLSADVMAVFEREVWRQRFEASGLLAEDRRDKTAEKYLFGYKIDYKMATHSYLFTALRAEFDKFSGFDQQLSAAVGYGYRVLGGAVNALDLELGAGVRKNKFDDGSSESESVIRVAMDYRHKFNGNAAFRQGLLIMVGDENTSGDSVTAVRANLIASISMEVAFKVKYNSEAVGNKKNTDTTTSVSLVYGF